MTTQLPEPPGSPPFTDIVPPPLNQAPPAPPLAKLLLANHSHGAAPRWRNPTRYVHQHQTHTASRALLPGLSYGRPNRRPRPGRRRQQRSQRRLEGYGNMPILEINRPDDTRSRASWIPKTSTDNMAATPALWFGVAPTNLPLVLPNIDRFPQPDLGAHAILRAPGQPLSPCNPTSPSSRV